MSLRLVNKERTYPVNVDGTIFHIISLSVGEKEDLCNSIRNVGPEDGAFDRLLDIITPILVSIDGYEGETVRNVLSRLEFIEDCRVLVQAIIEHCSLSGDERKNSLSSSEQPTPVSAGNAE